MLARLLVRILQVVDRIPPYKAEQNAAVRRGTGKDRHWCLPLEGRRGCMAENEAYVHECQKPGLGRGTRAVHPGIHHALNILVAPLDRVLVLLVGLRLPISNRIAPDYVLDLVADVELSAVAQEAR
jgi:hypothetical protein